MMNRALITGAAGGVGEALAKRLTKEGYGLVLTDRDEAALKRVALTLPQQAELIIADLRSEEDLGRLCDRIEDVRVPVDLLVNNAGMIVPGPVGTVPDDLMRAHVDINMTAPMVLSAAAARSMKARKSGYIFSIMSLAAVGPMKNSASYSASKFGLRGFMAALAMELHPHSVGVGGLFPSAIDTPMLAAEMANPDGSPLNFIGNAKPLTPDEIADHTVRAITKGKLETWLPSSDGFMASLMMMFPSLLRPVVSYLEKQGEKKKQAYLKALR
ncbi:SDR family oxidoreductase [Tateyamaria omphalii]|uniref:SDR family NAD(P)-dependent oxidoreductase n=1 Tax=Tateyamaria omphalii TaxID=299262 RepID=UPI001C997B07|nr:SDR family oxidoreductase [Tateyamaria omphalii]MBY5934946.1 SDR family oxidoreductase [Tateyamaria omphalii]